jgi:hypothetical protein
MGPSTSEMNFHPLLGMSNGQQGQFSPHMVAVGKQKPIELLHKVETSQHLKIYKVSCDLEKEVEDCCSVFHLAVCHTGNIYVNFKGF